MDNSGWATASYGRACAGCAHAKCKCLVTEAGGSCSRCRRLNRECRPAPRTRKMNPARKSVAAKTANLERRLDELTSLLQNTAQTRAVAPMADAFSDSGISSISPGSACGLHLSRQHTGSSVHSPAAGPGAGAESFATDDEILLAFRSDRLPFLPIMHIPASKPAAELKEESPFLWRCIVTLHCKDTARRQVLHNELKETASKALLVDCHRSFDLLQGLLVYLAWIGFECQPKKVSLGPFMQMLTGLVLDIGLNRAPPQAPDIPGSQFIKAGPGPCRPWVSLVRTMEERRAVLGSFLLCSTVCQTLHRTDSLRWTPHMMECLEILERAKETPNDSVLVQLVRTALVVDKVVKDLGYECDVIEDREQPRAPLSFYVKGLQSQIDEIRASTPPELRENTALVLHLYHAEIVIYETSLSKPASPTGEMDLTRLDHLYACLNSTKKRFDVILALPPSAFAYFPSTILLPSGHSVTSLLRLSTFEYPGWDLAVVHQTADLLTVTEQLADKLAQAAEAVGIRNTDTETDCFTSAAKIMYGLSAGWAARFPDLECTAPRVCEVPALPEIDQSLMDSWISTRDLSWLTDYPLYAGSWQS
ncbi:hypothetical protein BJX99DRAFT_219646 [Aspergillus californicus]